jgi:hypothetical protein
VFKERQHQWRRDANDASAGAGLRFDDPQASAVSFWAVRTSLPAAFLLFRCRIASVLPRLALQCAANGQDCCDLPLWAVLHEFLTAWSFLWATVVPFDRKIIPLQSECLALTESESKCYSPSNAISSFPGFCENVFGVVYRKWVDLSLFDLGRAHCPDRILSNSVASFCFIERCPQRDIDLLQSAGLCTRPA